MVTTTRFAELTATVAANFGLAARTIIVDHPLGGSDEAMIVRWADGAVEAAMGLFTT